MIYTTTDPLAPAEAMRYFRAKVPAPWSEIETEESSIAFRVAGLADLDVIDDVLSALRTSLEGGGTFEDFKASVGERIDAAWGGDVANPGWRLETIFRTNLQSAYQAGHYAQARAQQDDRPYWLLDVIEDDATSEICSDLDDKIGGRAIDADDPIWLEAYPPNHFNCRSSVITLTEEEAREQGILEDPPDVEVADGFDGEPGDVPDADPEEYDPDIAADVDRFNEGEPETRAFDAGWDEDKHPRAPAGSPDGGQFTSGEGGSGSEGGTRRPTSSLTVRGADPAKVHAASNELLGHDFTQAEAEKLLQVHTLDIPGAHHIEYSVKSYGMHGLSYDAKVTDHEGKTLLEVRRQISTTQESGKREIEVHHDLMVLADHLQGQGIGSRLFDAQLKEYQARGGIARITTDAAWVGQYQWPSLGFSCSDSKQLGQIKEEARRWLTWHCVPTPEANRALEKVKSIRDLSQLRTPDSIVEAKDGTATHLLGKEFLLARGNWTSASLIGLKFDLGPKSKELRDYNKAVAARAKERAKERAAKI